MPIDPAQRITGLVLAGGLGRRMGGRDKGLEPLAGRPLVAHVIERLAPQVDALAINANRNDDAYRAFGYPVIADDIEGFLGPLAGVCAGLKASETPLLATAPCDSPFIPPDLVARLKEGLESSGTMVAVPRTSDGLQPVFLLLRRETLPDLEAFLAAGGRGIQAWLNRLPVAIVDFDNAASLANINTPEELAASHHD